MPSLAQPDPVDALGAAAALAPSPPVSVEPTRGGGNNRVYRVVTADGRRFALKWYPRQSHDRRDRLGTEFSALSFLARRGITDVPAAIAKESGGGFALYQWIEGEPIPSPGESDMDAALAFLGVLHGHRGVPEGEALPLASEACLSVAEIMSQVDARQERLLQAADPSPELADFLRREFIPARDAIEAWVRSEYAALGWGIADELEVARRTLSPSDFGFHNALRRPGGQPVFLDFEYFGWDDPAKLLADFLQHPGMTLSAELRDRFVQGASRLYGADDSAFERRFRLVYPLYGLRWCMILLNEFLPERWQRRVLAGHNDRQEARQAQLAKARRRLASTKNYLSERAQR